MSRNVIRILCNARINVSTTPLITHFTDSVVVAARVIDWAVMQVIGRWD